MLPLPVPLAPEVTLMKASLLVAVQAQPVPDVTLTAPAAILDGKFCAVELRVKVQPFACVTVTVCPATVSVPVRAGPVLAATE